MEFSIYSEIKDRLHRLCKVRYSPKGELYFVLNSKSESIIRTSWHNSDNDHYRDGNYFFRFFHDRPINEISYHQDLPTFQGIETLFLYPVCGSKSKPTDKGLDSFKQRDIVVPCESSSTLSVELMLSDKDITELPSILTRNNVKIQSRRLGNSSLYLVIESYTSTYPLFESKRFPARVWVRGVEQNYEPIKYKFITTAKIEIQSWNPISKTKTLTHFEGATVNITRDKGLKCIAEVSVESKEVGDVQEIEEMIIQLLGDYLSNFSDKSKSSPKILMPMQEICVTREEM